MKTREVARVVLLNSREEVLLFKYQDDVPANPERPDVTVYWGTPGGGREGTETYEEAARRELREETGIKEVDLERCLWIRSIPLVVNQELTLINERYFLAKTAEERVTLQNSSAFERKTIRDYRWWSMDALKGSQEIFLPSGFVELIARILKEGVPSEPVEIRD